MAGWNGQDVDQNWLAAFKQEHGWLPWEDPGLAALGFSPEQALGEHLTALNWSQNRGGTPSQAEWQGQFNKRVSNPKWDFPAVDVNKFLTSLGIGAQPAQQPAQQPDASKKPTTTYTGAQTNLPPYDMPAGAVVPPNAAVHGYPYDFSIPWVQPQLGQIQQLPQEQQQSALAELIAQWAMKQGVPHTDIMPNFQYIAEAFWKTFGY